MGMSEAARAANPYAEHEKNLDEGRKVRDELLGALAKLDEVPEDQRGDDWWHDRDEVGTALRQVEQAVRSGELARAQAEGFATAMAPATISAEAQEATPAKPEE